MVNIKNCLDLICPCNPTNTTLNHHNFSNSVYCTNNGFSGEQTDGLPYKRISISTVPPPLLIREKKNTTIIISCCILHCLGIDVENCPCANYKHSNNNCCTINTIGSINKQQQQHYHVVINK